MILAFILLLSLQQFSICRVSAETADVSADLNLIRMYYNMPGLSALAMSKGQIVAQGASGYRREGNSTPLLATDPINIASCSKWMTATLAGRLVDKKLLSWTTQVRDCFPNFESFSSAFS